MSLGAEMDSNSLDTHPAWSSHRPVPAWLGDSGEAERRIRGPTRMRSDRLIGILDSLSRKTSPASSHYW